MERLTGAAHQFGLTTVDGCVVTQRKVHHDERGLFSELHQIDRVGGLKMVAQSNYSLSHGAVLRGMHFQTKNPQTKQVTCLYGSVLDVVFDLREDSPTFLKFAMFQLNWREGTQITVPAGCAHGFLTLSQVSIIHYNCDQKYDRDSDAGVLWSSPELAEVWPADLQPTISERDRGLPTVQQYLEESAKRKAAANARTD